MGALIACAALPACASNDAASGTDVGPQGVPGVDASIAFAQQGTLALAPGELVDIVVIGKPAARYAMSFLLVGESLDASLDKTQTVADGEGVATVRLRAPNKSTNFSVRAKIKDGPSADLQVAVSDQGFGALELEPKYLGGRESREWVASVVAGATCKSLATNFPNDPEGALTAAAEPGDDLIIDVAPVGPNLAVFVRGGHYMWGCVDEPNLVAGATTKLQVPIANAPVSFDDTLLDMDLTFAPDASAWDPMLAAQRSLMVEAFFNGNSAAPATELLAQMQPLSCDPSAFEASSTALTPELNAHLSGYAVDMEQAIETWFDDGIAAQPPLIRGQVSSVPDEQSYAMLELISIGTATPVILGVPAQYQVTINVDADDTARVGGTLFWLPSRYIGNAIGEQALTQYAQHTTMAEVFAEIAACDSLTLPSAPACDSGAISAMCQGALTNMWAAALDASASVAQFGEIPFEASGGSVYDDYARLTGFEGTWIGNAKIGEDKANVSGAVTAIEPDMPPP